MRRKRLTDIELDTIKVRVMQNKPQLVRDIPDREVQDNNNANEIQDIPTENITPAQNTTKACPDEDVLAKKTEMLRKWEVMKDQRITERPSLPKIRKDWHVCGAIEAANKAIKEIKEEINTSLTMTDINQIVYAMASTITEQLGIEPKKYKKTNSRKRKTPTWKAKIEQDIKRK